MNNLQNFNFKGNKVRTVIIENEPYFVGKDVSDVLGYSQTAAMTKRLDDEDFMSSKLEGMNMKSTIINESGLYAAIIGSKLPAAKEFKRWVTSEVLPTIRKHGSYMTPEVIEQALLNPDTIMNLAKQLKDERTGRLIAEQQVQELKPKADYYDHILANKGLVTITSIAKNYGWSALKLNKVLHELGIQYNQSGSWYLYSKYQDHGYTHTEPFSYVDKNGNDQVRPKTKWTQKGHIFIYETLKKNNILPMIEQKVMS